MGNGHSAIGRVAGVAIGMAALAGACSSPAGPTDPLTLVRSQFRADNILFTASATSPGESLLAVNLNAMNETDFEAQTAILGGNCMLRPRIYAELGGDILWSGFDLYSGCQEPLRLIQLGGGDEEDISQTFRVPLDPGEYFVTLTIDHTGQLVELTAGVVALQ
jgi:hypothetical protein